MLPRGHSVQECFVLADGYGRGLVNTRGNSVYLPRGGNRGLGQCTSFRIRAEKIGDGEYLGAAGAFPSETYLAAPQIAVATAPLSQEAFSARRAFVHRLSDEPTFLTQPVGEMGGCRSVWPSSSTPSTTSTAVLS